MTITRLVTEHAPAAIGPYSQGVKAGNYIFISGQLPVDSATGELATDIATATRNSLNNIAAILSAVNCTMDKVVKTTVFLTDLNDFAAMNAAYSEFFTATPPARSTIQVAGLPKGAVLEIEAIALVE